MWNKKKELWEKQTGCKIVEETVGWPLFRQRKVVIGPQYDDEVVDGEDKKHTCREGTREVVLAVCSRAPVV